MDLRTEKLRRASDPLIEPSFVLLQQLPRVRELRQPLGARRVEEGPQSTPPAGSRQHFLLPPAKLRLGSKLDLFFEALQLQLGAGQPPVQQPEGRLRAGGIVSQTAMQQMLEMLLELLQVLPAATPHQQGAVLKDGLDLLRHDIQSLSGPCSHQHRFAAAQMLQRHRRQGVRLAGSRRPDNHRQGIPASRVQHSLLGRREHCRYRLLSYCRYRNMSGGLGLLELVAPVHCRACRVVSEKQP